jgi:hypothetical protein
MVAIDLVPYGGLTVLAEEHGTFDLLFLGLPRFNLEPEALKIRGQNRKNLVARQTLLEKFGINTLRVPGEHTNEFRHPLGRSLCTRKCRVPDHDRSIHRLTAPAVSGFANAGSP